MKAMGYWLLAISLIAGVVAGCFSEREATAPAEGVCSFPITEGVPGSTVVVIQDFAFGPGEVRVRAGERVTWINCDTDNHTSTADGGQWTSPLLSPGDGLHPGLPHRGRVPVSLRAASVYDWAGHRRLSPPGCTEPVVPIVNIV